MHHETDPTELVRQLRTESLLFFAQPSVQHPCPSRTGPAVSNLIEAAHILLKVSQILTLVTDSTAHSAPAARLANVARKECGSSRGVFPPMTVSREDCPARPAAFSSLVMAVKRLLLA